MESFNVAYFAFDQFIPSEHAGFVHTHSIIKALREIGNNVVLYGMPSGYRLFNPFKWKDSYGDIPINYVRFTVSFKPRYKLFYPLNLISYHKTLENLRHQKPDILHERFHLPNPHSLKICDELEMSKILEVNSLYLEEGVYQGKNYRIALEERNKHFDQCKAIITQTKTLKNMIEDITSKSVFVVPNGVDTKKFSPVIYSEKLREDIGVTQDDILVTFLGSFRKWHGVHMIPEIAKQLDDNKVKLLLIGGGELFNEVKGAKTKNMILKGPVDHAEVPKYLVSSDILIAPFDASYFDQQTFWWNPVKLFEYVSSGKPVVSYDYKEVREIVQDAGLLAEIGDLNDFVEKLNYLIENESARKSLGKRGRDLALKEYDWKERAEETQRVYKKVF